MEYTSQGPSDTSANMPVTVELSRPPLKNAPTLPDVGRLATAGFDAFLIGESLLLSDDPARLLRELLA